jgi:hypothetical protein
MYFERMINMKATLGMVTILVMLMSAFAVIAPIASANEEIETIVSGDYLVVDGVLASDWYDLYPFEKMSSSVGFSKYGENIAIDDSYLDGEGWVMADAEGKALGVGLQYPGYNDIGTYDQRLVDSVDPFCNEEVRVNNWINGWVIDIRYTHRTLAPLEKDRHIFGFATFSDGVTNPGGPWVNYLGLDLLVDPQSTDGGRKCSAYAESEPLNVLYHGPRRWVAQSVTHIWDVKEDPAKEPEEWQKWPVLDVVITQVYDKVKKQYILFKDVKLTIELKDLGSPVDVQFSNRHEWDIGYGYGIGSYAHFYHQKLETCYGDLGWHMAPGILREYRYPADGVHYATGGQRQVLLPIDNQSSVTLRSTDIGTMVKFPVSFVNDDMDDFQPETYPWSRPVENVDSWGVPVGPQYGFPVAEGSVRIYIDDVFQTSGYSINPNNGTITFDTPLTGNEEIVVIYKLYKHGWGPDEPEDGGSDAVNAINNNDMERNIFEIPHLYDLCQLIGYNEEYVGYAAFWPVLSDYTPDGWDMTHTPLINIDQEDIGDPYCEEPDIPFVIGEWDFMLDLPVRGGGMTEWPIQFRGVSVYGVVNKHDASDEHIGIAPTRFSDEYYNKLVIDREALYLLDQVFNPWDLKKALNKDDWRLVEKQHQDEDWWNGPGFDPVVWWLIDPIEPKEGHGVNPVCPAASFAFQWDAFCTSSERVLVDIDGDGVKELIPRTSGIKWGESMDIVFNGRGFIMEPDEMIGKSGDVMMEHRGVAYPWWVQEDYRYEVFVLPPYSVYSPDVLENGWLESFDNPTPMWLIVLVFYEWDEFDGWIPWDLYCKDVKVLYSIYNPLWWCPPEPPFKDQGADGIDEFDCIPWMDVTTGRYEWIVMGRDSAAIDSAGGAMVAERFVAPKQPLNNPLGMEIPIWMSALDMQDDIFGPKAPYVMMPTPGFPMTEHPDEDLLGLLGDRAAYREGGLSWPGENYGRSVLRNDWCTTVPIESSNMITIGSSWANQLSEYANDFTDAYLDPGIPSGTLTPGEMGSTIIPLSCWSIWDVDTMNMYKAVYEDGEQVTGYGVVATTKDLDGTKILSIWGLTGQDTYYTSWALWMGWLGEKLLNEPRCVTAVIIEIDYTKHPTDECFIRVVETLGTISEYDPGVIYNWACYPTEYLMPGESIESTDGDFVHPPMALGPLCIWLYDYRYYGYGVEENGMFDPRLGMWMYRLTIPNLFDDPYFNNGGAGVEFWPSIRVPFAYGVDTSCVEVTLVLYEMSTYEEGIDMPPPEEAIVDVIPLTKGVDYFATEQGYLFVRADLVGFFEQDIEQMPEAKLEIFFHLKQPIIHDP